MILTKTPMRISLFGGGTDLSAFYERSQGSVFGGAINKYIYLALKPRFDGKIRASYSQTELVDSPDQLKHDILRVVLTRAGISGVDVASFSDAPPDGSGLGSSSAFAVGLVNAIYAFRDVKCEQYELAAEACKIEIDKCHKPIGKQDQYFAALGGVRQFTFEKMGIVGNWQAYSEGAAVHDLHEHLLLFYTGLARQAVSLMAQEREKILSCDKTFRTLQTMADMAHDAAEHVRRGTVSFLGPLLDESWRLKRSLVDGVTNPQIDAWYEKAKEAGAKGGKILGAGGGGFLVFFVPREAHANVMAALSGLRHLPFDWDFQGTQVVYKAMTRE